MKQIYALLLLLCVYSIADAQVKKGDIVLGGNLGYSSETSTGQTTPLTSVKSNNLYLNPSVGKAIGDNLVLGIDVSYTHSSGKNINGGTVTDDQTSNGGMFGVFVRRYKPIGAGFSLFGQAELSGNYSHTNGSEPTSAVLFSHSNGYGFALQLYPGIAYALNHNWQIETSLPNFFSLSYGHSKSTQQYSGQPEQTGTSDNFGISTSLTGNNEFSVGVRYFIGG